MVALDAEIRRRALAAALSLSKQGTMRAAYVFGSYVEGRADQWSDIDIAAFIEGVETWDLRRRARVMARVQKEAGFDIEAHLFPVSLLQNAEAGSFAAEVMRRGIRIWGEDEDVTKEANR